MWGWSWKWEEKQGGNFSNFWGAALFVTWGCEGLRFPSTYPSIPTQNSKSFCTFPWIFTPLLNIFLVLPNTFFSMMCKMWLKTQLLQSLALPSVVSWKWMGKFTLFPLVSFYLLMTSVFCAVPRTKLVMTFSQGHPFCPPVSSEHSSIGWWQEPQLSVGKPAFQFGPWCLSPTWFWETYLTFLRFQDPQL